jgi:hypothetical protein
MNLRCFVRQVPIQSQAALELGLLKAAARNNYAILLPMVSLEGAQQILENDRKLLVFLILGRCAQLQLWRPPC